MDENNAVELLEKEKPEQNIDDAVAVEIPEEALGYVAGGLMPQAE